MDPHSVNDGRPDLVTPVEDRRRDHRRRPLEGLGRVVLRPHLLRPDPEPRRVVGQPAQLRVQSRIVVEVSVKPGEQVDHLLAIALVTTVRGSQNVALFVATTSSIRFTHANVRASNAEW